MRVLLTGASGFVGSHVRRVLPDSWSLTCPVLPDDSMARMGGKWLAWDLRTPPPPAVQARSFDVVISVAAEADPATATVEGNGAIAAAVAKVAEASGCPIVHLSSEEVYGAPGETPFTWGSPPRPVGDYAVGKALQEEILREHARRTGLPVRVLVTGSVFGERQPSARLIPTLVRATRYSSPIPLVDGSRQWTYAGHLADTVRAESIGMSQGFSRAHVVGRETIYHLVLRDFVAAVLDRDPAPILATGGPDRPGLTLHRPVAPGLVLPSVWPALARTIRRLGQQ